MEDSQKSMHGISFVEVLCVTEATPNAQRACSNFCSLLLKTADSIMVKAFVAACSSKHKTPLLGKRYDKLASKKSKKNSEPLITSAFTAENQSGFIMIRTNDSQITNAVIWQANCSLAAVCVH